MKKITAEEMRLEVQRAEERKKEAKERRERAKAAAEAAPIERYSSLIESLNARIKTEAKCGGNCLSIHEHLPDVVENFYRRQGFRVREVCPMNCPRISYEISW